MGVQTAQSGHGAVLLDGTHDIPSTPLFPSIPITGYAAHQTYANFAEPLASYSVSSRDFSFGSEGGSAQMAVSADDFAVYRYGYVSYDGQDWRSFTFYGSALGGDWLNGSASATLDFGPSDMRLTQSRLSTDANFVVAYTCTRTGNTWDCHDGWQIWQFSGSMQGGQEQVVYAVNCGGGTYTAADGTSYSADAYYTGGQTYESGKAISGTTDDTLYSSERVSGTTGASDFSYDFPVQNGQYDVTLKFAEIYYNTAGARVFDAYVEGVQAANDLDLYATAGNAAAYDVTKTVTVSDGSLTITTSSTADHAKLSAILIRGAQPSPLQQGLVAYWPFDASGDSVHDSAGSNTGTLGGGVSGRKPAWTSQGKVGGAYTFDGVDDVITVPDSPSLSITGDLTIAAWVLAQPGQTQSCGTIVCKEANPTHASPYCNYALDMEYLSTNQWRGFINGNIQNLAPVTFGAWQHIAVTFNDAANTVIIYRNGAEAGRSSTLSGSPLNSASELLIGRTLSSDDAFRGTIDEVRIYNRTLSAQEVSALYSEGGGDTTPDECQTASECDDGDQCTTDECVQASPKYCTHTQIPGCGEACSGNPGEFLITDETYTYDESLHGFKFWDIDNVEDAPPNWKTPYDYENGEIYARYEVLSQPSTRPCMFQFGIWQNTANSNSDCGREVMSNLYTLSGPGSVVETHSSPTTWWQSYPSQSYSDAPVDFSRPDRFCYAGTPMWSDNRKIVSDWESDGDWALRSYYLPMTVRVTAVAVPAGGTFSGWDCWVGGGGGGGGSDAFSFTHYFISSTPPRTANPPVTDFLAEQTVADYDNDGDLDFASGVTDYQGNTGRMYLYSNNGGSNWPATQIGTVPQTSLGAWPYDVNDDGRMDIISSGVWYQNNGGGSFTMRTYDPRIFSDNDEIHDMTMADVNNDGKKDVIAHSEDFGTRWYNIPSDPAQSWPRTTIDLTGLRHGGASWIHGGFSPGGAGDLDGDGDNDIFRANAWLENRNNGATWVVHMLNLPGLFQGSLPYGNSTRSVIVDIDNDGDNDVVFSESDKVDGKAGIIYNLNGNFGSYQLYLLPQTAPGRRGSLHSLRVEDFNLDGRLDILSCDQEDMMQSSIPLMRWYMWTNTGTGWTEQVLFDNGLGGHDTIAADADQDGDMDILDKEWYPWPQNSDNGLKHLDWYENHAIDQSGSGTKLSMNPSSGWHTHGGALWEGVGGGYIRGQQNPPGSGNGGFLITDQTFGDFEMVLDAWPDYGVDSGVYVRNTDTDEQGYQVTIDYQPANPMGSVYIENVGDYREFSISDESHITGSPSLFDIDAWSYIWKENDWNQFRIRVEGNPAKITVWINGWKVTEYQDTQARFPSSGHIALQVHPTASEFPAGKVVRFRNIKVYPI